MKSILTFILFLPLFAPAQDFYLGIAGDFAPKVKTAGIRRCIGYHFDFTYLEKQRIGFVAGVGWSREALFSQGQASTAGEMYAAVDLDAGDNFFLDGLFTLYWMELAPTVVLYRHIERDIAFNLGVGVGFYYAANSWTWEVKNNLARTAIENGVLYQEDPIRPNFGYNIRTSFDFPMTRKSRLRFEGKYIIYRPSIEYTISIETVTQSIHNTRHFDLDALYLSLAIVTSL